MKRTISFFRSNARMSIPSDYYRDLGSPPFFQVVNHQDRYELRPLQEEREDLVCLPVKAISIRGKKKTYTQYILYLPVQFAGGTCGQPRKIDEWVYWQPVDGKLYGFIKKVTPGKTEDRGRS